MWIDDDMITPRESAFFSVWDEDQNLVNLKEQEMFLLDYIGLQWLYLGGNLLFYKGEGNHMHLTQNMIY